MVTNIKVFKLRPDNDATLDLLHSDFEDVQRIIGNFNKHLKEYYVQYYEFENDFGNKSDDDILAKCVTLLNNSPDVKKPLEYTDIIVLNDTLYFYDPIGWRATDEVA